MKKIIFALMLIGILCFSFISGTPLTKEQEEALRKGITINDKIDIGGRTFYPLDDSQGYVQLVENKPDGSVIFKTRNTLITTKNGIEIENYKDTYVVFGGSLTPPPGLPFIQIQGEEISILHNKFGIVKTNEKAIFVIDIQGELAERTTFQLAKDSTLKLFGKEYSLLAGTKVHISKVALVFETNKGGEIVIDGKKIPIQADDTTKFIVDEEGNFLEGTRFLTSTATYSLNGYSLDLPEKSVVEYTAENKILIQVPVGSQITPTIDNVDLAQKIILEIKTKEPGFLVTPGGKFQSLEKSSLGNYNIKSTSIFFRHENGKLHSYFTDEVSIFLNEKGQADFSVINELHSSANPRIDFAFDDAQIDSTYPVLLVTPDKIASLSSHGKGPIINILAGNRFSVGVNKEGTNELEPGKKTLSFQGIDGYAVLKKGEMSKLPTLEIKGNSFYGPDKKSFFGYNGQFYYNPNALIGSVNHGDGTPLLRTSMIDAQGKSLGIDIFSTPENGYVFVPSGQLKGPLEYYKGNKGTAVSNSVVFNQLGPQARQTYTELTEDEQKKLTTAGSVAALEAQLTQLELQRNPLRAMVTLPGCSGTIVGYHGDKAYIATADHCVRDVGSSTTVWLNSLTQGGGTYGSGYSEKRFEGKGIRAKVVATNEDTDVTLLEIPLTEEVQKRGYVRIPADPVYAKVGDPVMRIGCPSAASSYRQTDCVVRSVYKDFQDWDTINVEGPGAIGGESGGGLFKGNRLVGTLSTRHGFGNLYAIHDLLKRNGYDFLIQNIILIFYKNRLLLILLLLHNN